MYSLDCTHIDKWKSAVLDPAIEIVSSLLKGEKPEQHRPLNEQVKNRKVADSSNEESHFCQVSMFSHHYLSIYSCIISFSFIFIPIYSNLFQFIPIYFIRCPPSCFQICERIFIGELQWKDHLRSIKHKKVMEKKKRLANKEATTKKEMLEKAPGSA